MAEGFAAADYITDIRLSELQGKRLWLVRVPRHIDPARLEGAKVKLPLQRGREGKILGRVRRAGDSDDSNQEEGDAGDEGLVVRAADVAESAGFRALFSAEEDGALSAAAPFAGQLKVSVETPDLEPVGVDSHPPAATFVEPYRGRPQLKGMRVRSKPAGAGSEYKRTRPLANHDHDHGPKGNGEHTPPATPDQGKGGKRNKHDASSETAAQSQPRQSPAVSPTGAKKKKKRKSTGGGGAAAEGEQARGASPMAKKSKKKKTAER